MKLLKLLGGLLFFIVLVTAALSLIMPASQKITRSITINESSTAIFEKLKFLENFKKIAVWSQSDSTAVFTNRGSDGIVGSSTSWKGHPMISGEGTISITRLEPNRKVSHGIQLVTPKKGNAVSVFNLEETNRDITNVTWTFSMSTPRPWNIFNLFYSMDKEKGADFEAGLAILKKMVEMK